MFKIVFVLDEALKLRKLQGGDFKYGNSFLKLPAKNTQITHFSPKYGEFLFLLDNLHFEKFKGVDSKYDHSFIKFLPKKLK